MRRFFFDCGTRDGVGSTGLLALRLGIGLMMLIGHGWTKMELLGDPAIKSNWVVPGIWPLSLMSGPVSLMATIGAELGCAVLLVLGLMTRPAAFGLGFAMLVAAFQVNGQAPFFTPIPAGPAKELAVLYLIPCVVLIISGAGKWSIDCLLYKEKKRRFF